MYKKGSVLINRDSQKTGRRNTKMISLCALLACAFILATLTGCTNHLPVNTVAAKSDAGESDITYTNDQYGFSFSLPKSWKGYSIINETWEGQSLDSASGEKVVEKGPLLSIRHPEWTSKIPRQDIPIMIFTLDQWNALQQEKFHIGAAPIGPSELGRNSRYVFALPARYNFAYPKGYEEVEDILKGNPLHAIPNS
jgi:hypothetical protein